MLKINEKAFSSAIDVLAGEFPPESGITIEVLKRLCAVYEAAKIAEQPVDCASFEEMKAMHKVAFPDTSETQYDIYESWFNAGLKYGNSSKRESIDEWQSPETAPYEKSVLVWWKPLNGNKYAECVSIAQRCFVEEDEPESYGKLRRTMGCWWSNGMYYDKEHIVAWMPQPKAPTNQIEGGK